MNKEGLILMDLYCSSKDLFVWQKKITFIFSLCFLTSSILRIKIKEREYCVCVCVKYAHFILQKEKYFNDDEIIYFVFFPPLLS
jgi:hypothetical protein